MVIKKKTITLPIVAQVPVAISSSLPLPATTTEQEDIVTLGQRRINLIWELTQAIVAILITVATIYCEITKIDSQVIVAGFFLVIGVYLQRTNHRIIGGVGRKDYTTGGR